MFPTVAARSAWGVSKRFVLANVGRTMANFSSEGLVLVEKDPENHTAVVTMNRPPVNSLNLELLLELRQAIDGLDEDPNMHGFVLASSSKNVFSAGLDIQEMHRPDRERLADFWEALQNVFFSLYGTGLATVAAINGHSPAGGCFLVR